MTIAVLLAAGLVTIGGSAVSASSSSAAPSKDAGVFISPAASSTVSGRVTWQVGAITGSVYRVDFSIDGGPVTWSEWLSPYVYNGDGGTLDTTTLSEGAHTLQVVEYDSAGRVLGTAQEVVTVDNQPAPPPPTTTDHDYDPDDHTDDPDHHDHAKPIAIGIRIGLARDAELRGTVVQPVTDDRDHEPVAVRQRLVGSPSG